MSSIVSFVSYLTLTVPGCPQILSCARHKVESSKSLCIHFLFIYQPSTTHLRLQTEYFNFSKSSSTTHFQPKPTI